MNLNLSQYRGQCYDVASNMSGSKNGVSAQFQAEKPRAVLTHCYGHALNLAVGDALKNLKVCRDTLDTAFEICKLNRFSPKRNAAFNRIKMKNQDDEGSNLGIRSFCRTRWTVCGDAIESIIDNYSTLNQLWEECQDSRLDHDVKGMIIGVRTQMSKYHLLFGLLLCKLILKISDNLSRTLQQSSLSAEEGQAFADLSITTIKGICTEDAFYHFFKLVEKTCKDTNTNEPVLHRKKKSPSRFIDIDNEFQTHHTTANDHYLEQYCEAINLATACITKRFDLPGYVLYKNLETLLIQASNQEIYQPALKKCNFVL